MGRLVDKEKLGFGKRSWRYSMLVDDGVIVKIKGDYYKVNLSTDQQSYTLTKSYLINPEK